MKSKKIVKFEDRHRELERRIAHKNNVDENQGKSKCNEPESKIAEEHHWKVTSNIIEKQHLKIKHQPQKTKVTKKKGELAAAREIDYDDDTTAAARDKQDETMEAVAAKCGRQDVSMNIVADRAEAAVATHKLDDEEIVKDNQKANRAAATAYADGKAKAAGASERAEGEASAATAAAAAAAHERKENMSTESTHRRSSSIRNGEEQRRRHDEVAEQTQKSKLTRKTTKSRPSSKKEGT